MKFDGLEWHKKESTLKIRYFFSLKGTENFEKFWGENSYRKWIRP